MLIFLPTRFIQLFIILPILFFAFTRMNPYSYWLKCSPSWITAWVSIFINIVRSFADEIIQGSASSAATLPVTLKVLQARGVPDVVRKFTAPLGALINMYARQLCRLLNDMLTSTGTARGSTSRSWLSSWLSLKAFRSTPVTTRSLFF
jgi:Na+/H+-dicarboxylate symporter